MRNIRSFLSVVGIALGLALGSVLATGAAFAVDRVVLKDGTVIEGTIVREMEGQAVWIKTTVGGVPTEKMYLVSEYKSVEKNAGAAPAAAPATAAGDASASAEPGSTPPPDDEPAAPSKPGVPRGAVLTMGDLENGHMVGVYLTGEILHRAIPTLEKELGTDGTGVVVLRVNSGGGYGMEVQLISDVIQNEYKKRWRTVGWIDSAISAAAMSAHSLDEIYFTTRGNYGACVGFYGSLDKPVEGFELQKSLAQMEKISARGGYDPLIMRAMQVQQPLSCTIDANGKVHWYPDASSGEISVNRDNEILTFNAQTAAKVKFSKGTADTLPELARLMGYQEIQWVGRTVKGSVWPISRAEQMQMDFRKQVRTDEENTNRYYREYGMHVQLASQTPRAERAPMVGRARQFLDMIKNMVRNNPAFARNIWGGREEYKKWAEEQDKLLRELMK